MLKLKDLLKEALPTSDVDDQQFPNPVTGAMKKLFLNKGDRDGEKSDDIVKVTPVEIPAVKLKPSQDAIYLSKALGMAVGGVKGGDLAAIISSDDHILDGHHRWAATMLADPTANVGGLQAAMTIGDLIPVLRALGDVFLNKRRGKPDADLNIYKAKPADLQAMIANLDKKNTEYIKPGQASEFVDGIGGMDVLEKRLAGIQKIKPPAGAPPRKDMPVIDADKNQVKQAAGLLKRGKLDIKPPYADKLNTSPDSNF